MDPKVPLYKIIRNITSRNKEYSSEVNEWLKEDGNRKIYQDLADIWQVTGAMPRHFSPDKKAAWEKVKTHIHKPTLKPHHYFLKRVTQIAAAVLIIVLSVWAGTQISDYNEVSFSEVTAPKGQKTQVLLPDSSIVILNGGSSIRYNNQFNKKREVQLNGEGYFNVRKDYSHLFTVNSKEIEVVVYGTEFMVKNYDDDQIIEVGLKRGSVGIDKNHKEIARLIPGQMASFDKEKNKLNIKNTDIDLLSSWIRNELVFEEQTLPEIVKYLERWYGVEIKLDPRLVDGERLNFKIKTESLRELLALINFLKPIHYEIEGKQVTITKQP